MATLDKKQQGTMNTVAGVLPIAGTAIGSVWGPAGATVGGAAGGITGGILSTISGMLGEKPDSLGPTGAQLSAQSASLFNLSKLMSQSGLTAAQVSRMVELEGQADLASIQLMNVLEQSANMSPLAKEAVANTIVKETAKRGVDTAKNIANLDIQAEREREKALISGTAVASDVSTAIQIALTKQEAQENLWEQTRWTNFAANASAIGETAGALTEYFSEGTPKWSWDKNKPLTDKPTDETYGLTKSKMDELGLRPIDTSRDLYFQAQTGLENLSSKEMAELKAQRVWENRPIEDTQEEMNAFVKIMSHVGSLM